MVSSENINTSNIMQIELVAFRNIYVHAYMHVKTIKDAMNLKESKKYYGRRFQEERRWIHVITLMK